MRHQLAKPDQLIARLASNHHGVVGLDELRAAGLTKDAVKRRVAAGRLHRIHRGVYAVGHAGLSTEGTWMAAVKACGPGAALSHRSAAELWRMLPRPGGIVHVTLPSAAGRARREGIRLHRSSSLTGAATTVRDRIPVTTPARTVADLRRSADAETFRRAIREADVLRLRIAAAVPDAGGTCSELERRFLGLCRRHRLPRPEVNVRVGHLLVDFLWPAERLAVEVDGYGAHRGRQAFEDDRARDIALKLGGYEVARFTWRQVTDRPRAVARAVRGLLARAGPEGG